MSTSAYPRREEPVFDSATIQKLYRCLRVSNAEKLAVWFVEWGNGELQLCFTPLVKNRYGSYNLKKTSGRKTP